jgi:hypothetical protein
MQAIQLDTPDTTIAGQWTLPPLILHPFSGEESAEKLLEGSKASLMLHGLIPSGGNDPESLNNIVLKARVQELRMLYFLGKDLLRWIEQCVNFVERTPELRTKGVRAQSFSGFLVEHPPDSIARKLNGWGVTDQRSVFSRAIGVTCALNAPPSTDTLSDLFLKHYHRFVDYLYVCYQNLEPFAEVGSKNFKVEIYASAEYSKMLSEQWERDMDPGVR